MLKLTGALGAAAAALHVIPTATLGEGEADTLASALAGTLQALEILGGIEQELERPSSGDVEMVLAVTEPAFLERPALDAMLDSLHGEVNALQIELDLLAHRAHTGELTATAGSGLPPLPARPGAVSSGLDESTRELLRGIGRPAPVEHPAPPPVMEPEPAAPEPEPLPPAEPAEYTADALLQARACFRAGRFAQGIELLEPLKKDPEARYWLARCHEQLGDYDRAEELYRAVTADENAGLKAELARDHLEFLPFKRRFAPVDKGDKGGGGGDSGAGGAR